MKTPIEGKFKFVATNLTDAAKDEFLKDKGVRYMWVSLPQPIRQIGHNFGYIVAPMRLSADLEFESFGKLVLCQTEAEARESMELLTKQAKEPVVFIQSRGYGTVGKITNSRDFMHEVSVRYRTGPDGKQHWFALEREIDRATGEVTVLQRHEAADEADANHVAEQWNRDYQLKAKDFFDAVAKSKIPLPPPPRCNPLTPTDLNEDLPEAKWEAMRRQWPNTFALFERQKHDPGTRATDQECQDAYLLDLVEGGYNPKSESIRGDLELCTALARAARKYANRGKRKASDLAIYLIAFNWELGWCYMSDRELAEKLSIQLKIRLSPEQVEKYRYRTLGLVSKRLPGPEPKSA